MPRRHIIVAPVPGSASAPIGERIHGDNLEDEIRESTGFREVAVTLAPDGVRIAIPGERPAREIDELEDLVKAVVRKHRGITPEQRAEGPLLETTANRRRDLAGKVRSGEHLTGDEVREAVEAWLLMEAPRRRRFED